jgi:hypothetical protein
MTVFQQDLRHRCRNPKCRMKLPEPVANEREAFCTRGCHSSFYRRRCIICQKPMERRTETQLICGKRKCRNALARGANLGRYVSPSNSSATIGASKNPIKMGVKSGIAGDRAWRIIAGELTPGQLRAAVVPDGPNVRWAGGSYLQTESRNRALLRGRFSNPVVLIQSGDPPVNVLGGYRFPDAPKIELPAPAAPGEAAAETTALIATIPDDLSIPSFLRSSG